MEITLVTKFANPTYNKNRLLKGNKALTFACPNSLCKWCSFERVILISFYALGLLKLLLQHLFTLFNAKAIHTILGIHQQFHPSNCFNMKKILYKLIQHPKIWTHERSEEKLKMVHTFISSTGVSSNNKVFPSFELIVY